MTNSEPLTDLEIANGKILGLHAIIKHLRSDEAQNDNVKWMESSINRLSRDNAHQKERIKKLLSEIRKLKKDSKPKTINVDGIKYTKET